MGRKATTTWTKRGARMAAGLRHPAGSSQRQDAEDAARPYAHHRRFQRALALARQVVR